MFPVIHGILAQKRESCVYPLDVKPELINLLGFEAFNVHDKCGHDLTSSGNSSHAAISQAAAAALLGGGQIPEEQILPPSYLGGGIYAVEYFIRAESYSVNAGVFTVAAGGYRPLTPGEGGGNAVIDFSYELGKFDMIVYTYYDGGSGNYKKFVDKNNIRIGIYYNTITGQCGFVIEDEDIGYVGKYTKDEPLILMAAKHKQEWVEPERNLDVDVSVEVITKGQDLQLAYPEGTNGLDGVLVGA